MNEQLTMEQIEVIRDIAPGYIGIDTPYADTNADNIGWLLENRYIHCSGTWTWKLTDTGSQALAVYKSQRDLVLFIAEFEEWLEGELLQLIDKRGVQEWDEWMVVGQKKEVAHILHKYRHFKERIADVE